MPFTIVRQDIVKMRVDAVVNAANSELAPGGGVCGAIFQAAGRARLQAACKEVAPVRTGEAAVTPGYDLPAKNIIHAVGPVYSRQSPEESARLLRSAYTASLKAAMANGCESVAFPLISSGTYGYPKREALQVATSAIRDFLATHDLDVYLAVFDREAFAASEELLGAVESYLDENYVQAAFGRFEARRSLFRALEVEDAGVLRDAEVLRDVEDDFAYGVYGAPAAAAAPAPAAAAPAATGGLDALVGNLDEPFNTTLLRLIDAKGKSDAAVYKRANISRQLFSKIRIGKGYLPGKRTALALAIALELTLDETRDLLERAGYALSHSQKFDVIVEYFIRSGRYDIFEINEVLFAYDQPLLGAS